MDEKDDVYLELRPKSKNEGLLQTTPKISGHGGMSWVSISINIIGTILFIADFVLDLTLALTYLKRRM